MKRRRPDQTSGRDPDLDALLMGGAPPEPDPKLRRQVLSSCDALQAQAGMGRSWLEFDPFGPPSPMLFPLGVTLLMTCLAGIASQNAASRPTASQLDLITDSSLRNLISVDGTAYAPYERFFAFECGLGQECGS